MQTVHFDQSSFTFNHESNASFTIRTESAPCTLTRNVWHVATANVYDRDGVHVGRIVSKRCDTRAQALADIVWPAMQYRNGYACTDRDMFTVYNMLAVIAGNSWHIAYVDA